MKFDLRLKTEEVTLINKDGIEKEFVMFEATGTQRDIQQCFVASKQDKKSGKVNNIAGIKEHFLGMLLRHKATDAPVGQSFFSGFPGGLRNQLYDLAQQLSGMKTEAELLALLMEREMQKLQEKQEIEDAGGEYIDPDIEIEEEIKREKASGKE